MSSLVQAKCTNSSAGRNQDLGIVLQLFLDEVLHRLDVVVGGALDLLDPRRMRGREAVGQRTQAPGRVIAERRQLDDARLVGQRQQPLHLHLYPGLDQAVLGEDRPQRIDLAGIAAIERGQGEQGGFRHVGVAGEWAPHSKRCGRILQKSGFAIARRLEPASRRACLDEAAGLRRRRDDDEDIRQRRPP